MRVRDLFTGQYVKLYPHHDGWTVCLASVEGPDQFLETFQRLDAALEAAGERLLVLADERDLQPETVTGPEAQQQLREALIVHPPGEPVDLPEDIDLPTERDRLRYWLSHEMGWRDAP